MKKSDITRVLRFVGESEEDSVCLLQDNRARSKNVSAEIEV